MENILLTNVRKKILQLKLIFDFRLSLIVLIDKSNLSEKKLNTILSFKTDKILIGYLFRLLLGNAYKYGVPKIYIKQYMDNLNTYKNTTKSVYIRNDKDKFLILKNRMHKSTDELISATLELMDKKNSRKEKISQLLEKISDKNI